MNLKPCPFCGGEARTGYGLNDYNRWGVGCKSCSATVEVEEWNGVEDTEENAIVAWNKRTEMERPMDFIKVNINDIVKVKLTEDGLDVMRKRREETNNMLRTFGGTEMPEYQPDEEGYSSFQMWALMDIFGGYMTVGTKLMFETEILVPHPLK